MEEEEEEEEDTQEEVIVEDLEEVVEEEMVEGEEDVVDPWASQKQIFLIETRKNSLLITYVCSEIYE